MHEYNPQGKEATHKPSTKKYNNDSDPPHRKKSAKPFTNFLTKSKGQNSNINAFDNDNNVIEEDDNIDPTITSFVDSQETYTYDTINDDDSGDPTICHHSNNVICSKLSPNTDQHIRTPSSTPNYIPRNFTPESSALTSARDNTPAKLQQAIITYHKHRNLKPSKPFFQQHCKTLKRLPNTTFTPYCDVTFHVDGGVNCDGINDK